MDIWDYGELEGAAGEIIAFRVSLLLLGGRNLIPGWDIGSYGRCR